jgi:hypothetical protein
MTRIVAQLTQVLFALNSVYFATEKEALKMIETFTIKPREYSSRIQNILSTPGLGTSLISSLELLNKIIQEVIELVGSLYTPKYNI